MVQTLAGPLARIVLRYIVGAIIGVEAADALSGDPDVVFFVALVVGALIEAVYAIAKRKGWAT